VTPTVTPSRGLRESHGLAQPCDTFVVMHLTRRCGLTHPYRERGAHEGRAASVTAGFLSAGTAHDPRSDFSLPNERGLKAIRRRRSDEAL
jgi:hypothetical protein